MFNDIYHRFLNSEDKRRLFLNFSYLSVLQTANYILPFITLPYLVRILGPEKFGLIAFSQAFIQFFIILTDYGFNLSATSEISINRGDIRKISEIFSSVITIKFVLTFFSFAIMTIAVFSFDKFRRDWYIYFLAFGMVIGQVMFPVWFFQGMEKMKYITFLNILAKLIFTITIFIFIHKASDYIYVPLINSLGFIVAGVLGLCITFKDFGIIFKIPTMENIKYQLKEGWHIFISTVAISLYTISNTFILGLFTNNTIVGYYAAAEKIIKAAQGLQTPISQTIYPYMSKLVNESKSISIIFLRKLTLLIGGIFFFLSLSVFTFAGFIVNILLGNQYEESIIVLRILSFLPFLIVLSNIFGIQTMLTFNYKKNFSNILISASFINIILAILFVPFYKDIGMSFSVLISETFVTFFMFVFLYKKGIRIIEGKIV
jgi:PST family polysaccharide transporter